MPEPICADSEALSGLVQCKNIETTPPRSRESILDSVPSFINVTPLTLRSGNHSFHQGLARIYQELAENRAQIKRLSMAIELRGSRNHKSPIISISDVDDQEALESSIPECDIARDQSSADDIFLDCVSRFSLEDSTSSIGRLQAMFSGLPYYFFETNPSFYPEQYVTEGLFSNPVFVFAITQSDQVDQIQEYFLAYAKTPRRRRRIIMSVAWKSAHNQPDFLRAIAPDNREDSQRSLSSALAKPVSMLLPELELLNSVTRLSLRNIVTKFAAPRQPAVDCDECYELTTDMHYHCDICWGANFDLCPTCFAPGIRCLVPQHQLTKKILKSGYLVEDMTDDDKPRSED